MRAVSLTIIEEKQMQQFENYEQVATHLLNEFAHHLGLARVEAKQHVRGQMSGTVWEIDAKGITTDGVNFIIIECRRYPSSRPSQDELSGLAWRIQDTGARGGFIVTPLGIQEGAAKVAAAATIESIRLDASSTTADYVMRFLNRAFVGASHRLSTAADIGVSCEAIVFCRQCGDRFHQETNERLCPHCAKELQT